MIASVSCSSFTVPISGITDLQRAKSLFFSRQGQQPYQVKLDFQVLADSYTGGTVRLRGLRGSWRITAKRGGYVPALPGGAPPAGRGGVPGTAGAGAVLALIDRTTGAITVEVVFNWPGLGTLTVEAGWPRSPRCRGG